MKQKTNERFIIKVWLLLISIAVSNTCLSQTIIRQSISSYGGSSLNECILFSNTTGQCYNTITLSETDISVLPGFQQPNTFSVEEIKEQQNNTINIEVFPNPASFSFTIKNEGKSILTNLNVTDINGREIFFKKISDSVINIIDCSNWENGIYLINISDINCNNKSLRLIISK